MDWRKRRYYCVKFDSDSVDFRLRILKSIKSVKFYPYRYVPKQLDEHEDRGFYHFLITVNNSQSEIVEYELKKAQRNDSFCFWKEIKKNICKEDTLNVKN